MIKNRNIDFRTPARTWASRDAYTVQLLPTLATGFCSAQNITTTEATLNMDGLYVANPLDATSIALATAGTLAQPSDLWFTLGGAIACTGKIQGWDHLGKQVYFEFSKAAAQTVFTLAQSAQVTITKNGDPSRGIDARSPYCCFSAIDFIKITGASAQTCSVGVLNNAIVAARMPRIPLPTRILNVTEICDAVIIQSAGGATMTTPAAVPGQAAISTTIFGSNDLLLMTTGGWVETVAGTDTYKIHVPFKAGIVPNL